MLNWAPATPSAGSELFLTRTAISILSPGYASFSGITHSTEPLTGGIEVEVEDVVSAISLTVVVVVVTVAEDVVEVGVPTVITPGITLTFQESEFCPLL